MWAVKFDSVHRRLEERRGIIPAVRLELSCTSLMMGAQVPAKAPGAPASIHRETEREVRTEKGKGTQQIRTAALRDPYFFF